VVNRQQLGRERQWTVLSVNPSHYNQSHCFVTWNLSQMEPSGVIMP